MLKNRLIASLAAIMMAHSSISHAAVNESQIQVVTSKMLLQLRPDMTKSQVQAILGIPLIHENLNGNRWDYIYQRREGNEVKEQRLVILVFEGEQLKSVRGTIIPIDSNTPTASQSAVANTAEPPSGQPIPKPAQKEDSKALANKQVSPEKTGGALAAANLDRAVKRDDKPADDANVAADGSIVIDGEKLELQLDRKMRALGNASIHQNKQDIFADRLEYDMLNDELHAVGNVRIQSDNTKIVGPELRMQLSENIGEMHNASISMTPPAKPVAQKRNTVSSETFARRLGDLQSQQIGSDDTYTSATGLPVSDYSTNASNNPISLNTTIRSSKARGDAESVLFEGEDKKRLLGARYTTCDAGVDDWYIKASEISLNDYTESGSAKNARIEFKGVPLLYTPWISFSFNDQRKSGFLSPTIGSTSRSGFEALVPYYWNIAPNMDATLAARALSKRGVQLQGEFRYMEDNYAGISNLEYLPTDSLSNETRYYANLKHQHKFGNGWSAGYSLEKVSDDQYFSEMSTRIVTTSRVNLPQQFNVDYVDDTWRFNAIAQKFQTLKQDAYPYERLPQMTLVGNKYYDNVNANLYSQLSVFDINKNAPLNSITGQPRVTGVRSTIYPSISIPMSRTYGYVTPKLGIHYTSYSLNDDPNNQSSYQRTLPIFSLDSGLYFDRDFKIASRGYSQTLEPRLFYVYIPERDQSNIPIFDSSLADLNFSSLFSENQFVGNDRINNANQLSFALTSRFIESSTGTQRLSASIGQRYYFADQKVTLPGVEARKNNSSDIIAGISAQLRTSWIVDAFWQYNTDNSNSVRSTISGRYNPEPGKVLNLSYSYRQDSIDQSDISAQWPLGKGWYGIGRANYSFRESRIIETIGGLEYDAGCWQARSVIQRVSTATAEANYALFFQLELGGLASIGANPLKVIQRNIPGYVSAGLIPDTYQQPYYE
ncbi:LPS assembly protein LptD [Methylotenera sp. G11]|uniref:LPS assembly protein LptD n=1 Tax=Methylotenera sp. G11 TaxID=1506585 RepID=UPI0009E0AA17|nr:LPS assembly protein LptD [Methylotenera sp. G11]